VFSFMRANGAADRGAAWTCMRIGSDGVDGPHGICVPE
jgi:hypothetical protein